MEIQILVIGHSADDGIDGIVLERYQEVGQDTVVSAFGGRIADREEKIIGSVRFPDNTSDSTDPHQLFAVRRRPEGLTVRSQ